MKKLFLIIILFGSFSAMAQNTPEQCNISGVKQSQLREKNVMEQWEYKTDKKTKKKTLNSICEYDEKGCMVKRILPGTTTGVVYTFNEWKYDEKGRMTSYKEGSIDADSAKSYAFSENYNYSGAGLLSNYRKEVYEGEFSQTVEKWEYNYSPAGEKTESSFSKLLVRKDTISNDEIKYAGNGNPIERSINKYFPKGLSEFYKYNAQGLPMECIRYEKGKMTSHKIYSYQYSPQGALLLESNTDGVGKTSEKKKYEKDKITYTLTNSKGKVLKTSSEPLSQPVTLPYPVFNSSPARKNGGEKEAVEKTTVKEKIDKKKNKVEEYYIGTKLQYTDTYNPQGLLIEKNTPDIGFTLQYEYTFY